MRTGTGTNHIWAREEGKPRHGDTQSDITPPSRTVRPALYTIQRGGGVGALEASRDTETGQDRRPPGRRPFWEPWRVRGLGRPWRSGELGRPWRVRGLGRPWRIGELGWPWWIRGLRRPWRSGELGWPWWIRGLRRPWRSRELGRPWRNRVLGRPWRSRELGRPWRSRELGRPWRIGELGRPWRIGELGRPPWWVAPPPPQNFIGETLHLRSRGLVPTADSGWSAET